MYLFLYFSFVVLNLSSEKLGIFYPSFSPLSANTGYGFSKNSVLHMFTC